MTDEIPGGRKGLRSVALLAGTGIGVLQFNGAYAAEPAADAPPSGQNVLEQVTVFGQKDAYKIDTSGLSKLAVPLIDVAQSVNTISQQELQDRAVADLNQALKTVPGVTIGAGEFRSIGTSPTIRGFVARTDMFMDGIRDYGDYYRDPFNLEAIEVLEGPAGVVFGRGSTGGVIEQDSKLPKLQPLIAGTLTGGTDSTRRVTIDVNEPLTGLGEGAAFRINAMGHKAMVADRNVVDTSRYGFAPSLSLGLGTPTRLTFAYFRQYNDDIPDYGLPYFGTLPAQVPRDNYYGFRDDFMHTLTDVATFKIAHDFPDAVTIENQTRYARYSRDFRFTEPLIAATIPLTTPLSAVAVTHNDNTGRSVDSMLWDQLNVTIRWSIGGIDNVSVVGIEGGHERVAPEFDNSSGVPNSPLLNPNENLDFTATSTFPRYRTHLTANSVAPYVIDTVKFTSAAPPMRVLPPLFNRYSGGHAYGGHIDGAVRPIAGTPFRVRTDLSATLFLADPAEYDGGELMIGEGGDEERVKLPAGDMVLYSGGTVHRVTPVTRGVRLAAFFWVQGMVRDESRRTILFDFDNALQQLSRTGADHEACVRLAGVYHNLLRQWADA